MLSAKFKTRLLINTPKNLGNMAMIKLPTTKHKEDQFTAKKLHDDLWTDYNIECMILVYQDQFWVRITCHIYNELSDFEKFGNAILKIFEKW